MQKNIIVTLVVVGVLIVGGLYFYSAWPSSAPVQNTQNTNQNVVVNTDSNVKNLSIVAGESKATYELNEKLRGTLTHVVGSTGSVSGTATVNLVSPAKIEIGEVKIDATSFKTDIAKRDENVVELVLKSNQPANQYITFTPTDIIGVPATIEAGKDFSIKITGNMTVLGISKPITFEGVANVSANNSLTIKANTKVTYGDFGVTIPDFSFLSDVDKTVDLSINLIAR